MIRSAAAPGHGAAADFDTDWTVRPRTGSFNGGFGAFSRFWRPSHDPLNHRRRDNHRSDPLLNRDIVFHLPPPRPAAFRSFLDDHAEAVRPASSTRSRAASGACPALQAPVPGSQPVYPALLASAACESVRTTGRGRAALGAPSTSPSLLREPATRSPQGGRRWRGNCTDAVNRCLVGDPVHCASAPQPRHTAVADDRHAPPSDACRGLVRAGTCDDCLAPIHDSWLGARMRQSSVAVASEPIPMSGTITCCIALLLMRGSPARTGGARSRSRLREEVKGGSEAWGCAGMAALGVPTSTRPTTVQRAFAIRHGVAGGYISCVGGPTYFDGGVKWSG